MKVFDCEQRSPEWHAARVGMFTASCAGDMLAKTEKGSEAAKRRDLRLRLVLERLTGVSQENGYVNADMQRGIDKEADAIAAYEALTGNLIRPVGFIAHDTLRMGCSPDGIVGDFVGGAEIKCPKSATHLAYLRGKTLPKEYVGQIQHSLFVTGAEWWDFLSFDDRFPEPLRTFYIRVKRNETEVQAYEFMARQFLNEIDKELADMEALAGAVAF
jgi:hypothetical protein